MKWLADENFKGTIFRGLKLQSAGFDIVRAQDVPEIYRKGDVVLLSWATQQGRAVLTHDVSTMPPAIQRQLELASRCAPVILVPDSLPIGSAIEQFCFWTPARLSLIGRPR